MKKLFSIIILLGCCFVFSGVTGAFAKSPQPEITAKSAYLIDAGSGTVIYSKNPKQRLTIASMTKIMLLDLCFEKLDEGEFRLEDEITVSKTASGMGGSQVFLEANKNYKAGDLIKSIAIASANDASVAMAERLYGSEENCVAAMNAKCEEWGLDDTLFSNCTGLPKPTQYSCAQDVAVMLQKLITHKEYFMFSRVWTDELIHDGGRVTGLTNTNKLIRFFEGCDGGKTGYTSESGFCLAATAKRGAMRLVSVIINAQDSKTRFSEASKMFNYGFDNYAVKMIVDAKRPLDITVGVEKGKKDEVQIVPEKDVFVFSERNKQEKITVDFKPYDLVAPINKGDEVGELKIFKDGVEYATVKAVSLENIDRKIYFDYIKDISENWII